MITFIPTLSTQAGSCLTMKNWQEVNADHASYSLATLLMKPGIDVLKQYATLRDYTGFRGKLVLNASTLTVDKHGKCQIRSSFDGARLTFDFSDLLDLIIQWAPDFLLLPKFVPLEQLSPRMPFLGNTQIFVDVTTPLLSHDYHEIGVYIDDPNLNLNNLTLMLQPFYGRKKYLISAQDIKMYSTLSPLDVTFIESDRPAADAISGLIYTLDGNISVADSSQSMCFDILQNQCQCPTCEQKLSRAYLSHLYQHTPLLCHRFLIQHNVFHTCHLP